jgi:formamidopyrimidine-DNA glycosylase
MPELPEVETTRAGLAPHCENRIIRNVVLRRPDLRWPIPKEIKKNLPSQTILQVRRRAKYLLLDTEPGSALLHLGMSGCLRVLPSTTRIEKHDHVDIVLDNDTLIRFTDPRRFGCLLWQPAGEVHSLLQHLGPEPLSDEFSGDLLYELSRGRRTPIKHFLMDQSVVVGVGNIYAAESLFKAGIAPQRMAGTISRARYQNLAAAVKSILAYAIARGGTTLRDFLNADGAPGYFEQELFVYGREGCPCKVCGKPIQALRMSSRASAWCRNCQN